MLHRCVDLDRLTKDCKKRGINIDKAIEVYNIYKSSMKELDNLLSQQKQLTGENMDLANQIKQQIKAKKEEVQDLKEKVENATYKIPNYLDPSVPEGKDEKDNVVIKEKGEFYWNGIYHWDMPGFSINKAAGSRWPQLEGQLCKMARKLQTLAMDHLENRGFKEYYLPQVFPKSHFKETGHFHNPDQTLFQMDKQALIPTSEVSLLSVVPKIIKDTLLLCSYSLCFRKEVGAAGKDLKGLIRNHQFMKVEMVAATLPDTSQEVHEYLLETATSLLDKLGISYRIVQLCTGDIGNSAYKTYDIEAPIGNQWREIASISNCHILQSIGLKIKTQNKEFAHTLNGTCLAIDRVLGAMMEKYYNPNTKSYDFPQL